MMWLPSCSARSGTCLLYTSFGRPSTQWKLKTDEIGNYADKADASYTKDVKLGDIYADLGLSTRTVPTIIVDGKDQKNTTKVLFKGNSNKVIAPASGTANGVLTEAYVDDDDNVTLVQINTYVGTICLLYTSSWCYTWYGYC